MEELLLEEWRPLAGEFIDYPYEVSNTGCVRSLHGGCFKKLTPLKHRSGYVQAVICKSPSRPKRVTVHRLVQFAFKGPPPTDEYVVNHIDGNKRNNCASNLEWCTHSENLRHALATGLRHPRRKLSSETVRIIRDSNLGARKLAKRIGVSRTVIRKVRSGHTYRDVA